MVKIFNIFILFSFISLTTYAQTAEIESKNKELSKVKSDIVNLENKLISKSEEEKKSSAAITNLKEQNLLINKLIKGLKTEEEKKTKEIVLINQQILNLQNEIKELRDDYSRYIVWLYKNGSSSTLKYIFNAESINQAAIRYKYLSYITEENKITLDKLKTSIEEQKRLKTKVISDRKQKEKLVEQKEFEKKSLAEKRKQLQNLLVDLKEDQSEIQKEIEQKRISEVTIKKIIARLNEEERKRRELLRTAKLKNKSKEETERLVIDYDNFENFISLKGKLGWPVNNGDISRPFGENKNQKLNTVTLNYGIDIKTKQNTEVFCVAEGVVSAIDWIPGYGSIIIITHRGNYRTVYGHLSEINVREGQRIKAGILLGIVDESLEGNIIHFEIWNERNYLNPQAWLSKK